MGAWGGYKNGQIPSAALTNFEGTGKFLHPAAAASLSRLLDAVQVDSGFRPFIASSQDLYRDLARQQYFWANRGALHIAAAYPGTSNHGWALAADITFPGTSQASWHKLCASYGWNNAGDNFNPAETWHKEYVGSLTITASTGAPIKQEEDDMTPDQAKTLAEIHQAIYTTPDKPGGWRGLNVVAADIYKLVGEIRQAIYSTKDQPGGWDGLDVKLSQILALLKS